MCEHKFKRCRLVQEGVDYVRFDECSDCKERLDCLHFKMQATTTDLRAAPRTRTKSADVLDNFEETFEDYIKPNSPISEF